MHKPMPVSKEDGRWVARYMAYLVHKCPPNDLIAKAKHPNRYDTRHQWLVFLSHVYSGVVNFRCPRHTGVSNTRLTLHNPLLNRRHHQHQHVHGWNDTTFHFWHSLRASIGRQQDNPIALLWRFVCLSYVTKLINLFWQTFTTTWLTNRGTKRKVRRD